MKRAGDLWEKFISRENFELAVKNSQKGKRNRRPIKRFNENREENITKLIELVSSGKFHTSQYKQKIIYEPKERIIYKLPYYPDRIVQHAVMNVLKPILLPKFIENSYACINGRGQHKACDKCYKFVQHNQFCLKCDIHKFYPSINQKILSEMFHNKIKDKRFLNILDEIIFSFPGETNCPIGNYCSQWFGNYYLTSLDNFVYHKLKCKKYLRYCDDFMLFSNDKAYLQYCKKQIKHFIETKLILTYSKAQVFNVKQGVDFCGYRNFKNFKLLRKSTLLRLKRRINKIKFLLKSKISQKQKLTIKGQLDSAYGVLSHASVKKLLKMLEIDIIYKRICLS